MGYPAMTEADKAVHEKEMNEISPMKRHAASEETAAAVLFLAFETTITTGTEVVVDGGLAQGITPYLTPGADTDGVPGLSCC
jgi:NAD(P)-dependent dehydrogenase (short-subunit alcohol dehydrogenase family)